MLNYWWVTRPKRKLNSVPDVLSSFADLSLNQEWQGQRGSHLDFESALEAAGLKRKGDRRDQTGGGGRTYKAWMVSLGLIFTEEQTGQIKLTLAGEAIMNGDSPVAVLKEQVFKYQFPSAYSVGRGVQVSDRFKIRPFRFLLKLLADKRISFLTEEEIGKIIITEAENETDKCYEYIVEKLLSFRDSGDSVLSPDFFTLYKSSKCEVNPEHPYSHLTDVANTLVNWLEYTQLVKRDEGKVMILPDKVSEVMSILSVSSPMIDRPNEQEYFQRKYGLDPNHKKDTRNLSGSKTITAKIIAEQKIRQAYIAASLKKPISKITASLVDGIAESTGFSEKLIEETLQKYYPNGSVGAFMTEYFEMAFKGTEEAVDFEKATTSLFSDVFGYNAIHFGQTGALSAPDVLLISDSQGYQAIIDNKAYSKYSITGDHHNRMVHNYIKNIGNYSSCPMPIGFFSYIAGGFGTGIDNQIEKIHQSTGISGSAMTVSNMIGLVETYDKKRYDHAQLRDIFSVNRQVLRSDL